MPNRRDEPEEAFQFGPFRLLVARKLLLLDNEPVRIGQRALDILIALTRRRGEVVGKGELMALVWPDTHVDESNLRAQIAAVRKVLGDGIDGARYVVSVAGRGYSLVATVTDGRADETTQDDGASRVRRWNIPARLTPVIGRDHCIAAIAGDVRSHRFVTVVGPGGIGKTTVATSVAALLAAGFDDPAFFVDLSQLVDANLVAASVAAALGVRFGFGDSADGLVGVLRDRHVLIVLDSCEPVIEGAADFAETILKGAFRVHILATSREPMHAEGEHVFRLPALEIPPTDGALTAQAAMDFGAIQLFVERTKAGHDGYVLSDTDAMLMAEICRRLDGVPLAIELAATWVAQLGLRDLAERLDERFSLLMSGRRTALPRHQTLRATLDWSFHLLLQRDRDVLCRVAVFRGIFTREAAQAVAGPGLSDVELAHCIALLVDKSFLAADVQGPTTAYRCPDVTRAYLREKLQESGVADEVARLHARFFTDLFERAGSAWDTLAPAEYRHTLGRHSDNVRAALEWAFGLGQAPEIGIALTAAVAPMWNALSSLEEARRQVERALAAAAQAQIDAPRLRLRLFAALGAMTMHTDGSGTALEYAWSHALKLAEELGDVDYELRALRGLMIAAMTRNYNDALIVARRYRITAAVSPDPNDVLIGDRMIGYVLHHLGEHAQARSLTEGMLVHYVSPANRRHLADGNAEPRVAAKSTLARILWAQGFSDQAKRMAREALEDARAIDHPPSLFFAIVFTCQIALVTGDLGLSAASRDMLRADLTTRHPLFRLWSDGCAALDRLQRGEIVNGLAMLTEALQAMREDMHFAHFSLFHAGRIEGLYRLGRLDDALAAADAALVRSQMLNEHWFRPELIRLRGEVLLRRADPTSGEDAEREFQAALDLAQKQTALAWALRAATSLARLQHSQGRDAAARETLSSVYDRFGEGFDSADLLAARALLSELHSPPF